jgi:predicted pyridoxine 5'-phosphate oxidase superfamily flavin-nucleotide-binding protein
MNFHRGELAAQQLAGVSGNGGGIRDYMPDQHRLFFEALPFMLAATVDAHGQPRASVLHGQPGFVYTPSEHTIRISAASTLEAGRPVGLLGLDFGTRRRNRANGVVRSNSAGTLVVDVLESFGNCPQHITLRDVEAAAPQAVHIEDFTTLSPAARTLIAKADTLFVASTGGEHGIDMSHRGGPPGFVRIDGNSLVVPDFKGNRYFNTLGNMLLDDRAALLFIDFYSGDVLELRGRVQIDWASDAAGGRSWRLACEAGTFTSNALPLRWKTRGSGFSTMTT